MIDESRGIKSSVCLQATGAKLDPGTLFNEIAAMDLTEQRLNEIWSEAPQLELQKKYREALLLWREALKLKLQLGITGSGDVTELDGIKRRIDKLVKILGAGY